MTQCGYIAIIGRPNVGKSTLLNYLLSQKISITSAKPQTTRYQILGIKSLDTLQAIYIDTPGIHASEKFAMNRYLNRLASAVIPDADVIAFMMAAPRWQEEDELVLEKLKSLSPKAPVILVINKIDQLKDKKLLLPLMEQINTKYSFAHIIPISAYQGDNVTRLEAMMTELLPQGPYLFSENQLTDKNDYFRVGELIREKVIQLTEQEIPYSTIVEIEAIEPKEKIIEVRAIIWVEREGQKAIVIGDKGDRLKRIGTLARKEIEKMLQKKVFLRLWVKVKEGWTNNEQDLKKLLPPL